jgi:hypothetical protein
MKTNRIMARSLLTTMTLLAAAATACADTIIAGGNVSGTWTAANSPYIVRSNITVVFGTQLTIEPGVVVRFQAGRNLAAYGNLTAVGEPANKIIFTSDQPSPAPGGWDGISCLAIDGSPSWTLRHCVIEYGRNGINAGAYANQSFTSATFLIEDTIARSCSESGIRFSGKGSTSWTSTDAQLTATMSRCQVFSNLLSGVLCGAINGAANSEGKVVGAIKNNAIYRNGANGITVQSSTNNSTPNIVNNTIFGNTAAGLNVDAVRMSYQNNIIVSNALGMTAARVESSPVATFNDVWGNGTNWAGAAAQFKSAAGNIAVNPFFAAPDAGDFHLRSQAGRYDPATATWIQDAVTSPCIDAGDPASAWGNEPQPNGGRINLGADGNTPFASKSLPTLTGTLHDVTKDFVLSWGCAPDETYTVLYSTSPAGPWLDDLPGGQLTAGHSQTVLTYTNINGATQPNRFYRVRWNTP